MEKDKLTLPCSKKMKSFLSSKVMYVSLSLFHLKSICYDFTYLRLYHECMYPNIYDLDPVFRPSPGSTVYVRVLHLCLIFLLSEFRHFQIVVYDRL